MKDFIQFQFYIECYIYYDCKLENHHVSAVDDIVYQHFK